MRKRISALLFALLTPLLTAGCGLGWAATEIMKGKPSRYAVSAEDAAQHNHNTIVNLTLTKESFSLHEVYGRDLGFVNLIIPLPPIRKAGVIDFDVVCTKDREAGMRLILGREDFKYWIGGEDQIVFTERDPKNDTRIKFDAPIITDTTYAFRVHIEGPSTEKAFALVQKKLELTLSPPSAKIVEEHLN